MRPFRAAGALACIRVHARGSRVEYACMHARRHHGERERFLFSFCKAARHDTSNCLTCTDPPLADGQLFYWRLGVFHNRSQSGRFIHNLSTVLTSLALTKTREWIVNPPLISSKTPSLQLETRGGIIYKFSLDVSERARETERERERQREREREREREKEKEARFTLGLSLISDLRHIVQPHLAAIYTARLVSRSIDVRRFRRGGGREGG